MVTDGATGIRPVRVPDLRKMKQRGERITALTAYDYLFARIVDEAGADVILVGDTLAEVMLGLDSTLPITLDDVIYHAQAVRRGIRRALLAVDLPFLSYQISTTQALESAGRVMKETGASAIKLEGGDAETAETVQHLVRIGIPVMAHIGFTPQAVHTLGGYRVQGREAAARTRLLEQAKRMQDAGAFSVVLELMPGDVAEEITEALEIPTIGIGAGPACDGQILVLHDMLGLNPGFAPRFLRRFAELGDAASAGVREYVRAVRAGEYPAAEHTVE